MTKRLEKQLEFGFMKEQRKQERMIKIEEKIADYILISSVIGGIIYLADYKIINNFLYLGH